MRAGAAVIAMWLCGCDVVFGLSGHPSDAADGAPPGMCSSMPDLDPAGCACNTPGAVQSCFHGDNGSTSACHAGGVVTCGDDHVWSACAGGAQPSQEVCFDGIDNDCDGVVDNGCACAHADNVCFDAGGRMYADDTVRAVPGTVGVNGAFSVWVLSRGALPQAALQTETTFCTGATSSACTVAGACTGWTIIEWAGLAATTSGVPHMFNGPGTKQLKIRLNDAGPCVTDSHEITGSLVLQ